MNCLMQMKEGAELLLDYCSGSLDARRAAEIEKHIESCGDCRRAVEAQGGLWATLDRWTPPAVSTGFDARLYQRIAQEQSAPPWRQWLRRIFEPAVPVAMWKPVVSLAAACAVLVIAMAVRTPEIPDAGKQIRTEKVDIEQVANALEDLEMLTPASAM